MDPRNEAIEEHLDQLLAVQRFEPPASFVDSAQVADPTVYASTANLA